MAEQGAVFNVVPIEKGKGNTRFIEEGRSRLTPLQAINLIEHWCSIVEMRGLGVSSLYRFRVCSVLIELENRNEDWHFEDFVEWINNRFSKMTDKDWKTYIKDVNKGKCI